MMCSRLVHNPSAGMTLPSFRFVEPSQTSQFTVKFCFGLSTPTQRVDPITTRASTMSIATRNATVNWYPPIHHVLLASTDPAKVTLAPGFTALVLGSWRGIGLATAIACAKAGATSIILASRDATTLASAEKNVRQAAKREDAIVKTVVCDVCSDPDLKNLAKVIGESFGRLDALIFSGTTTKPIPSAKDWPKDVHELDIADFKHTFEVNFFAGVSALKVLMPLLEGSTTKDNRKAVVWLTSSTVHNADPKKMGMGYALSKFAASRFVEVVHEGHREAGVTVFGIQPGSVWTV